MELTLKSMSINFYDRQRIEKAEENLAPYASRSKYSRGRIRKEEPCQLRTEFQRDRDRIIHCNAFRRLKHKTQVFIAPLDDHYVTRLTHTLEVAQIARTIARALNSNEDLTEAIALGHDLGHTPFGHIGEEVLNNLSPDGFRHNEQSLRIVDMLENNGQGLNLTWEVRDGILNHSKGQITVLGDGWNNIGTVEGQIVKIADMIAYINHDIRDAIRANIITEDELPISVINVLGNTSSQRINTLVYDIVTHSINTLSKRRTKPTISMSPNIIEITNNLREFLFENIYNPSLDYKETKEARGIIYMLYYYFVQNSQRLPDEYTHRTDGIERKVVDYIAGMTDHYAVRTAREIHNIKEQHA